MRSATRRIAVLGATVMVVALLGSGTALAQEPEPPPPPEINCYPLLSSLVCYLPVQVGPFNIPVNVDVESVFPPQQP